MKPGWLGDKGPLADQNQMWTMKQMLLHCCDSIVLGARHARVEQMQAIMLFNNHSDRRQQPHSQGGHHTGSKPGWQHVHHKSIRNAAGAPGPAYTVLTVK